MTFAVRYSAAARDDLRRLYQHLLERCTTLEDLAVAERALEAVESAVDGLAHWPFICRKAAKSPFLRELVIPFGHGGHGGYGALFVIEDGGNGSILEVRHQLEDD